MAGPLLLSNELSRTMEALGLSPNDLADILGTDRRTVLRWLSGETFPQHASRQTLEQLMALDHRLNEMFESRDAAREWLQSESGYFGGLKPIDALLRGRIDAVDAALEALDSGIFV
jgi:transcriptional regulator with XRE-family HTH domain